MNTEKIRVHELEQFRATLIELKSRTNQQVVVFDGVEVNIEDKLNEIEERLVMAVGKGH